ncbi:hypothetical protein HEB29_005703 [Streptomyces fulvorobeus]|uniref:Uncharacterized protein n=1 Tax=Streptomyces fulvorobeus TaxID=284028 RepID=A0A7Y9HI31_9ACTN|nr:hypothetical protein [Streptomyces fulvorobeus]
MALLILFVLPGVVYQLARDRWTGPVPGERVLGERVLRAIVASIVLDAVYATAAGPWLFEFARGAGGRGWPAGIIERPRASGALALLLLVVVPALVAGGEAWWSRRRRAVERVPTPGAWDHMFRTHGSCFVRLRLRDGTWIGGWFGASSYASAYPQNPELFLERAWRMGADGTPLGRIESSRGLYVRAADVDVIELMSPEPREGRA